MEPLPLRGRGRAGRRPRHRDRLRRVALLPRAPPSAARLVARRHGDARPAARRRARRRSLRAPPRQTIPPRRGCLGHSGRVPDGDGTHRQLHRRPDRRCGNRCLVGGEVSRRGGIPPSRGALRRRQEPAADGLPAPRAAREPHAGRRRGPVHLLVRLPALLHRPVPRLPHPPARPRHRADAEHRHGGGGRRRLVSVAAAAAGPPEEHRRMGSRRRCFRRPVTGHGAPSLPAPRLRRPARVLPDHPEQLDSGCARPLRRTPSGTGAFPGCIRTSTPPRRAHTTAIPLPNRKANPEERPAAP